ncbi:hypothetical protein [Sphingomonas parapaucimobilis]|uniref:Uncharacterized protein n=1 Tax=Sphingomonas parapaucimobilis NBRC 15100 TaxID=1219049 RepID=A0A0A1W9U7_9SPHN|nr:hypothetical protein [Sphingomonas parapaucimobilis]GAM02240.1 hypothetical protein SP5_076_00220 [Sphingomonas parapaucimobilis NBRC 15100]
MTHFRAVLPDRRDNPMLGIVNGMIGSLAIWALIAGVVVVAS